MYFILSDRFIQKLGMVREDYSNISKVNLDKKKNPHAVRCFFGVKDSKTRKQQILFIEKWMKALDPCLLSESTPEVSVENYFTALALLVAVCLYIKSQIKETYTLRSEKSAILTQLINSALGISSENRLDKETQQLTWLTARRYLGERGCLESLNQLLDKEIFSEQEWHDFTNFLDKKLWHTRAKGGLLKNYPCTKVIQPLIAKSLGIVGGTAGQFLGDGVGQSIKTLEKNYALTAVVGSAVLMLTKVTPTKIALMVFSPVYSDYIIKALCGLSVSWMLQKVGNVIGEGVGFGVGMSLDLSWKLLVEISNLLKAQLPNVSPKTDKKLSSEQEEHLNGFCLMTRTWITNGVSFSLHEVDSLLQTLPKEYTVHSLAPEAETEPLTMTANGL